MSEKRVHSLLQKLHPIALSDEELKSYQGFPAHILKTEEGDDIVQTSQEHCEQTGKYAAECLSDIGLEQTGKLLGILHDEGKFQAEFRDYIIDSALKNKRSRPKIDHSSAGLQHLEKKFRGSKGEVNPFAALLGYAIAAHHGLFNCMDDSTENGIVRRCKKEIRSEECIKNFYQNYFSEKELEYLFQLSQTELTEVLTKIGNLKLDYATTSFLIGQLERLLLSALIEGDRRDTAEFMNQMKYPDLNPEMDEIWENCIRHLEQKIEGFKRDTERIDGHKRAINEARQKISDACKERSNVPCGIYRLNVKTGGGKTISSLRFALSHAKKWHKKRIILVEPLISILEQNVDVVRSCICKEYSDLILEHHSNLVHQDDENKAEKIRQELLKETWNAPIIVTTMVQLFNTLFDGRNSSIRRMHSLCDSILIIDEVQSVPENLLSLFNFGMQFLSSVCNTTVLLCSATQPPFERAKRPIGNITDLIHFDNKFWEVFQRTKVSVANAGQSDMNMTLEEIADYAVDQLSCNCSLLIICNTKKEAQELFQQLNAMKEYDCYHLSAAMCMAHRRETLSALSKALESSINGGKKVLCISTQVIEAGVDISFGSVIRFSAGIENIVQSAGRCNRNGELDGIANVSVVTCKEENTSYLKEIGRQQNAFMMLLQEFLNHPESFENDLTSDMAIHYYYETLYNKLSVSAHYQDDEVKTKSGLSTNIFSLLGNNEDYQRQGRQKLVAGVPLYQSFKTAGELFQVIDTITTTVIVPFERGKDFINDLCSEKAKNDYAFVMKTLEEAKPYTITIYEYQRDRLEKEGALKTATLLWDSKIDILSDGYYDERIGFSLEQANKIFMEV